MKFITLISNFNSKRSSETLSTGWREAGKNNKGEGTMSKNKMARRPFMGAVMVATLVGLVAAGLPETVLGQTCNPGMGGSIGVSGPYVANQNYIHVGETATISQLLTVNVGTCTLTNLKAWVVFPDSTYSEVLDLNQLANPSSLLQPSGAINCPSGDSRCMPFTSTYQVKLSDIGSGLTFQTNWPPGFSFNGSQAGQDNRVLFQLAGSASAIRIGGGTAQEQPLLPLIVLQPCVSITKNCNGGPFLYGQPIAFAGVITNCSAHQATPSNATLYVQSLNDNPAATIHFATTTSGGRTFDGTLQQDESVVYSGSYLPQSNLCGPFTDTVQVVTADLTGFTVTNSASAICTITTTPCIGVTKTCPGSIVYGTTNYVVSGVVTNCGNVPLIGVTVVDDNGTPGNAADDITINIGGIPVGGSFPYSATNTVPVGCGPFTDTVVATGNDTCSGAGVTNRASCTTIVITAPAIAVMKVCPPNPVQPGGLMIVTGTVTNTGNVPLVNVVVTNSISALGISRQVLGPISLAPGAGTNFSDSYIVPLDSCGPYADTFAASGADKCFGRVVASSATVACPGTNSPRIEVTKNCPAVPTAPGQITTIFGVVSNAGNVTLTNVIVVDDQPSNNTVVLGPITLIPGQAVNFSNSYRLPRNSCTCVDTVIASGADKCFGKRVTDSATAACPTATDPRISVTKTCPPLPVSLGEPLVFFGTVSNAGNITLTNVIVVDNQPSNNTPVFGPVTLAPGNTASFIGEYVVPIDICDTTILDTVTARGNNLCNGATVSASQSALCPIQPTPRLVVTKNCPVAPVPPGGLLAFSGSVSNAGNITLTNVMVFNDHPTNNTPLLGPITLAPNQSTNFSGSYRVCAECCPPYVDTITAAGAQICNGSNVTATATAYCPGITTPRLSLTVNCPPDPASQGQLLVYSGSVSNAGDVALGDILVTDDKAGFVTEIFALAPGETEEFVGFFVPTNCGPNLLTLVSATAWDVCTGGSVSNQVSASCLVICPTNQPPSLISPSVHTNVFTFSFGTVPGKSYTVEFTPSLSPVNWQTLTNFIGDGSVVTISDPPNNQQRFYRVLVQ